MSDVSPPLSALGAFPLLQILVGGATVLAAIYMMFRGEKDRKAMPPPAPMPDGVQMFMNGPLVSALACLREQCETLKRIEQLMRQTKEDLELRQRFEDIRRETEHRRE